MSMCVSLFADNIKDWTGEGMTTTVTRRRRRMCRTGFTSGLTGYGYDDDDDT